MFNTTREQIAEAITGTFGGLRINGTASRPKVLSPGSAWPQVTSIERGPGHAFLVEWAIVIVLANDETVAINTISDVLPDLVEQIETEVAVVDNAVPVNYPTSAGDLFALQINVRSE